MAGGVESLETGGEHGREHGFEILLPGQQPLGERSENSRPLGKEDLAMAQDLPQQAAVRRGKVHHIDGTSRCQGDLIREFLQRPVIKRPARLDGDVDVAAATGATARDRTEDDGDFKRWIPGEKREIGKA
jgi:hypothetical protein